jgi:hypothetical protein
MFRALVWKEWRQLGLVRWGGIALGAVLPLAFLAGAQLASHGLLPTGTVKEYSSRDLMYELLPAGFALGLWPLIGLLVASQAFGGDRAAGTENFLLERPVPRAAVWRARLTASIASLLLVLVATAAVGVMFALLSGPPPQIGWTRWLILSGLGLGLALLAWIGAMLAATLLPSPLGAVLLGGVVGGVPALLAGQMTAAFPNARYGDLHLGMALPWILVPAYVAASFFAASRGEPAGRGRVRRGAGIAVGALAAVIVIFIAAAPIAVQAHARSGTHGLTASVGGGSAFIGGGRFASAGGWIADLKSGKKLRFLAPWVGDVSWKDDGSIVAVVASGGPLGSERERARLEFYASDGTPARPEVQPPDSGFIFGLAWSGDDLVGLAFDMEGHQDRLGVVVLRGGARDWTRTGFERSGGDLRLMERLDDGRVALLNFDLGDRAASGYVSYRGSKIFLVNPKLGKVEGPIFELSSNEITSETGLSPSGRFVVVSERAKEGATPNDLDRPRFVRDVATRQSAPGLAPSARAQWLSGDRLAWTETRSEATSLIVASMDGSQNVVRTWSHADVGIVASPDRRAIFVSVLPQRPKTGAAPAAEGTSAVRDTPMASREGAFEEFVYLVDEDRIVSLGPPFSDRLSDQKYTLWAGPKTLARIAPGVVALEDLNAPGKRRFVLGSESDLR